MDEGNTKKGSKRHGRMKEGTFPQMDRQWNRNLRTGKQNEGEIIGRKACMEVGRKGEREEGRKKAGPRIGAISRYG